MFHLWLVRQLEVRYMWTDTLTLASSDGKFWPSCSHWGSIESGCCLVEANTLFNSSLYFQGVQLYTIQVQHHQNTLIVQSTPLRESGGLFSLSLLSTLNSSPWSGPNTIIINPHDPMQNLGQIWIFYKVREPLDLNKCDLDNSDG